MKRIPLFGFLFIVGCATVPQSYVERLKRLEREVEELRQENKELLEEARRLREATKRSEEYEKRIRDFVNEERQRKGMHKAPRVK